MGDPLVACCAALCLALAGCAAPPLAHPEIADPCARSLHCRAERYARWHDMLAGASTPAADFFLVASEVTRGGRWPPVAAGSIDAGAPVGPLARALVGAEARDFLRRLGAALYVGLYRPTFEALRAGGVPPSAPDATGPALACALLRREGALVESQLVAPGFSEAIDRELSALLNHRGLRRLYSTRLRRALESFGDERIRFSDPCQRLRLGVALLRTVDPPLYAGDFCACGA